MPRNAEAHFGRTAESVSGRVIVRGLRYIALAAALVGVTVAGANRALPQAYPAKPITVIVAQPPGSGPDTIMRLFAEVMSRDLGQRVLVVNQPGAGGALAATTAVKAAPDGYTLLLVLGALHTIGPAMQKLPFDAIKDFSFISLLYASSGVLLVPPQSPANNLAELVELLKRKGANATYGSPALGSPGHFQGALLAEKIDVPAKHVAYRGGPQLLTDLTGGLLDYAFISTIGAIAPIAQHQARGIAVGSDERVSALPDVPTLKELGFGDVAFDSWLGLGGPKGLPPEVISRIGRALAAAAEDGQVKQRAAADHVALLPGSQDAFLKLLASDTERVTAVVKRLGMKAE
jgi:tripartite-type tricarboxylate transporter receptor subunit TctC